MWYIHIQNHITLFFQISAEKLVRVIGIMDKHVLDAAELQLDAIPVSFTLSPI